MGHYKCAYRDIKAEVGCRMQELGADIGWTGRRKHNSRER